MFKQIFVYFKGYRKDLIGAIVCVIFECAFEIVIPLIMADILDVGVPTQDRAYIMYRGLDMVGCALAALLLGACYARFAARAGQGFGAALRQAEYQKVQSFSFSNMDRFSTPSLITRLTSDVTILQNTISNGLRPIVRGPAMLVMGFALSVAMSPKLAFVFAIAAPILALCLWLILRKLSPLYRGMQRAMDRVNAAVQENLIAIRTVKSYVMGDREAVRFASVNNEYQNASQNAFHYAAMNLPCFLAVMYTTILCLLWFGGNLIIQGSMQVGQLTGFLSYVLQILNSLMMISNVFLMLSRSTVSVSRIFEVLEEVPEIVDGAGGIEVTKGDIEFDHVFFKYNAAAKEDVLSDICLHIPGGSTVGIIGGTGSAKTSLVQLIPRLYDVSSGSLKIDGHDVREYSVEHLRKAVGMVLQNNTLFSGTIRDNLCWGDQNASDKELDWACSLSCADEFLSRFPEGYDTDLGQGGVNVSGGQKQRLCIARALLRRPNVLILDDSTSAVDTATEAKIREQIAQNLKTTTKIIITQRIAAVEDADLIIVLDNGRINAIGTNDELMKTNHIYQDICTYQRKGAVN